MIQRKQSLWLLIAALINSGLFYFTNFTFTFVQDGNIVTVSQKVQEGSFYLPVTAFLITLLPIILIFLFKNRKLQLNLTVVTAILNVIFAAMDLAYISSFRTLHKPPIQSSSYSIGSFLPIVALIFLVLAILGIRKDDKLVKSMDRLR